MRIALVLLLVSATLPTWGAERDEQPQPRPTVLDLSELDRLDVEPFSGALLHGRVDVELGEGDDRLRLERTWATWGGDAFHFGFHWASVLDLRVEFDARGERAVFVDERGFPHRFKAQGGVLRAVEGRPLVLEPGAKGWALRGRVPDEVLVFDAEGRVLTRSLHSRVVLTYTYREGLLASIGGSWGSLELVRDGEGRLIELRGPGRLVLRYRHNARGELVEVARGRRYAAYAYDGSGRLSELANGQGRVTYDRRGRVSALSGPGLHPLSVRYAESALGAKSTVTRGELSTECLRSHDGRRLERRFPNGSLEVLTLDERNRPRIRSLERQRWTWQYDERGRITRYRSPEGDTKFRYREGDRPTAINLPNGLVLGFRYDARGLVSAARHPALGNLRARHDEAGRMVEQTDARGAVTRFRYDERGYLVEVADPSGATRLVRSAEGDLSEVHAPNGRVTKIDASGDQRRVRVSAGPDVIEEVTYDRRGRPTQRREGARTIHYRWNLRGELLSARDALGTLASFRYDSSGRIQALVDAGGNEVVYRHPDAKTVVVDDPTSGRTTLRHDSLGRLVEEIRAGATLRYTYDDANRLIRRTTPRGDETFVYGPQGRLLKLEGPDGGYRLGYDAGGRLTRLENLQLRKAIRYRYDAAGDRVAAELPWGRVGYRYDTLGRLAAVTTPEGQKVSFERLPDGRRSAIHYPNGAVTRFTYKGSRLERISTRKGEKILSQRSYAFDKHGAVTGITDAKGRVTRYERDARGRLVREVSGKQSASYRYDAADNLLVGAAKAGEGNRLQSAGTKRYRYDARGALSAVEGPEGTSRFRYDVDGHLVEAQLANKSKVTYGYAPNGTRLWRKDAKGRTDFLNDLSDVVGEYREGSLERSYVHGEGLDDVLSMRQGKRSYYYHYDQVRSVTALSDAKGKVAARYRYSAFGETQAAGPVAQDNPFRYTSRSQDAATGLYHYRARTYDPAQGRFTSPDPFGRRGGLNLYAYALNDPTRFNDPFGLWPNWLDKAVNNVTDVVSQAADSVVSWAKNNPVTKAIYEGGKVLVSFGKGFGKGLWSGVKGMANMVLHPVQTYNDIKWAVNNWDQVKEVLGDKWDDYQKAWSDGDWNKVAEMTGYVLGEVTAGFVGTKGIDKIAKLGAVGRVARAAAATRPAQAVARGARAVAGATAPVRAAAAPVLRPLGAAAKPVIAGVRVAVKPFDWTAEKILDGAIWAGDRVTRPVRQVVQRVVPRVRPRGRVPAPTGAGANAAGEAAQLGKARLDGNARLGGGNNARPRGTTTGDGGARLDGNAQLGRNARLGGNPSQGNPGGKPGPVLEQGSVTVQRGDARGLADKLRDPNARGGPGTRYVVGPSKPKPANAVHDAAYTQKKHSAAGSKVQRDLRRGRDAHVFDDDVNLGRLEEQVWKNGDYNGNVRGWDRWSYTSDTPIGHRLQNGRDPVPLNTVEIKGRPTPDGGYEYHLVPRTKPAAPPVANSPAPPKVDAPKPVEAPPAKPHGDLYRGAKEAWSEPVPPRAMADLNNRWAQIDRQAKALAARRANATPAQRTAMDAAEEGLRLERMGKSGTVKGKHGSVAGTDGASIASNNWRAAEDMVSKWAKAGEPLTVEKIQKINAVLGEGLANNGFKPGVLRSGTTDVSAGGNMMKSYVPAKDVERAMGDFMNWYRGAEASGMPPVELAARSYQRLISIHPFPDANGRTTRLVMDYVLQRNGLPPASLDGVNVAVFGSGKAYGVDSVGATPAQALETVTKGVETSLQRLNKATGGRR